MTSSTTTSQDVKDIQDRQSNGRGAVIDAASAPGLEPAQRIEAAMMALVEHWRAEADIWEASKRRGSVGTAKELRQCASRLAGFAIGLTTRPVTISIPVPPLDNKGGGCGDPNCDFQVQCGKCSEASERQYDEWYARAGYSRSMHRLVIDEMREQAHAEAIAEHEARKAPTNADRVGAMAQIWDDALAITADVVTALPGGDPVAEILGGAMTAENPEQLMAFMRGETDDPGVVHAKRGGIQFPTSEPTEEQNLRDIIGPLGASASATALVDNPFTRPNVPWLNRPAIEVIPYQNLPVIASVTPPRDHVSHSYVESYESCSLAAMLRDASRAGHIGATRPGWSMIAGNAFHAAVEAVERAALTNVMLAPTGPDLEAFWMAFLDAQIKEQLAALVGTPYADSGTWYVANRGKEGFDWWRVEGARMLKLYLDYHTPAWRAANQTFLLQDKTPVIELEYDMTIRSLDQERGLQAKGFIDKATLNMETYSLTVLDYKTGARDPDSTFQLGEYGHALLMAMGIPAEPADRPILGSFWLARKGIYTTAVPVLQRHPMEELQYRYDQAARGNKAGIFAPHVSNFCTSCSVAAYCPTQAGRS